MLTLSVLLAVASLVPITCNKIENRVLLDDVFRLTHLEIRQYSLGSLRAGDNVSVFIREFGNLTVDYSIVTYGGIAYANKCIGYDNVSFISDFDYYEVVFSNNEQEPRRIHLLVQLGRIEVYYPNSWLEDPARLLFLGSLAIVLLVLAKSVGAMKHYSTFTSKNEERLLARKFSQRLTIGIIFSLVFWLMLLMINNHSLGGFEDWYTDHARHPYSANLFTKVGFSIFDTPLGRLASLDASYYKFVTWPEMPHLYPLGSLFLFLPFGLALERGFPRILVFKTEIAVFLIFSHACLYYFLKSFLKTRMPRVIGILGMCFFYISAVIYSANGMFDVISLLFSLVSVTSFLQDRYDRCLFYAAVSTFFKYQGGIFLLPLVMVALLRLKNNGFLISVRNKMVLFGMILAAVGIFTIYSSIPFLLEARPELITNSVNIFNRHSQSSWEMQSFAILITFFITLLATYYFVRNRCAMMALSTIFMLLPGFTMPYFQPWYSLYFFVYALAAKRRGVRTVAVLWIVFMICVFSFGSLSYNPILIWNRIRIVFGFL